MRKFMSPLLVASQFFFLFSCTESRSKSGDKVNYPYTIPGGNDWKINPDPKNTLLALNALKALENRDFSKVRGYLGDSLELNLDSITFKGPTDNTVELYKKSVDSLKSIHFKVDDWESVSNKDNTEQWVSIWYNQYWELNGKIDSVSVINDLKIKDDKIIQWNEYVKHFPLNK